MIKYNYANPYVLRDQNDKEIVVRPTQEQYVELLTEIKVRFMQMEQEVWATEYINVE